MVVLDGNFEKVSLKLVPFRLLGTSFDVFSAKCFRGQFWFGGDMGETGGLPAVLGWEWGDMLGKGLCGVVVKGNRAGDDEQVCFFSRVKGIVFFTFSFSPSQLLLVCREDRRSVENA